MLILLIEIPANLCSVCDLFDLRRFLKTAELILIVQIFNTAYKAL